MGRVRAAARSVPFEREPGEQARRMALVWGDAAELAPLAGDADWDPREELATLRALDDLLSLAFPDLGGDAAKMLDTEVLDALNERYYKDGWWYRSERLMLLPRRQRGEGFVFTPSPDAVPLQYTCVVEGDANALLQVTRMAQEDEVDGKGVPRTTAASCAAAPLVGRGALTLDVSLEGEDLSYGPVLRQEAIVEELIDRVLDAAEAAGAAILIAPEYSSSPEVCERWVAALSRREPSSLRWVVAGSGPLDGEPEANTATILSYDGRIRIEQPKMRPFNMTLGGLREWKHPDLPDGNDEQIVRERLTDSGPWQLVECNGGRFVVAVCESFQASADATWLSALGQACPTLVLCPVFSKPGDKSRWERSASAMWQTIGADVVIANSVVVGEWMNPAEAQQGYMLVRRHGTEADAGGWVKSPPNVSVTLTDGVTPAIVSMSDA